MTVKQVEYKPRDENEYNTQKKNTVIKNIQSKIKKLGLSLEDIMCRTQVV